MFEQREELDHELIEVRIGSPVHGDKEEQYQRNQRNGQHTLRRDAHPGRMPLRQRDGAEQSQRHCGQVRHSEHGGAVQGVQFRSQ